MGSVKLIESILNKNTDQYVDTVKKLAKIEMYLPKECAAILIASGISKLPHIESTFIEVYKGMVFS